MILPRFGTCRSRVFGIPVRPLKLRDVAATILDDATRRR